MAEKLEMMSSDIIKENIDYIAKKFPNALKEVIVDGKVVKRIDFDILKQQLSPVVIDDKQERFQMTWPDKKKSILLANSRINSTLRPIKEKSVDFENTENLYIEGDNLDVLKLLRETYLGKIKMIYIDPPYNTGNDFIYEDDFSQSTKEYLTNSGQYDDQGNKLIHNTNSNGRYHTDWLNMMYSRMILAKDFLSDDGVIFISIDDNEDSNLTKICDEIFGERNFLGKFIVNSTPNARDYGHIGKMHEYILFYAKNIDYATTNQLPDDSKTFKYSDSVGGFNIHPLYNSNVAFTNKNRPNLYYPFYVNPRELESGFYEISLENKNGYIEVFPPKSVKDNVQFVWRWGREKSNHNLNTEIIGHKVNDDFRIVQKMRHDNKIIRSLLLDKSYSSRRGTAELEKIFDGKIFSFPKPLNLIYDLIQVGTDENSIIMDFFSGSATTAHAVMKINADDGGNRKYIMIQLPELVDENSDAYKAGYKNICEIGQERIKRTAKSIKEQLGFLGQEIDLGFRVLKLDSSNMNDVYYNPKDIKQDLLEQLVGNIKEDRTPLDLLFQVMLELGIELSAKIEEKELLGKKYFVVNENDIVACFDDGISDKIVSELAKIKPIYVVFKDSSFESDSANINSEQIFRTISPSTRIKVI